MAQRQNQPGNGAEDLVFGNLDLDGEDLGVGGEQDLDLDEGEGEGGGEGEGEGRQQLDDLRVSHTQDQGRQQQQQRRQFRRDAEVRPDGKGNLVNAEGKVVAKAGAEARLYQDLHRSRQSAQSMQAQVTDVQGRLAKAVEIGQELARENEQLRAGQDALKQFNLKPEDQLSALQLYNQIKTKPVEAIRGLLTRMAAGGIDVASITGQGGGGALDPKTVAELVREEVAKVVNPIAERNKADDEARKKREEAEKGQQETTKQVENFFAQNPDAREYMPVFHQVLSQPQFSGMSLGEIWARIQLNLVRSGTQRRPNSPNRRSLPAGRGAPAESASGMAPVNSSYDDILKDVLTEHNVR